MPQTASKPDTTKLTAIAGKAKLPDRLEWIKTAGMFFSKRLPELESELSFSILPTKVLQGKEPVEVAGFKISKLGYCTTGLDACYLAFVDGRQFTQGEGDSARIVESEYYPMLYVAATLVLRFYYDVDWEFTRTLDLDFDAINDLAEFLFRERERWVKRDQKNDTETSETEGKSEDLTGTASSGDSPTSTPDNSADETSD